MSVARCERKYRGGRPVCGTVVTIDVLPGGKTVEHCPRCAWHMAGRCWECGATRENQSPRAMRCERCRVAARKKAELAWMADPANRAKKNAATRRRWRQDPTVRERKRIRDRAWRAAHPDRVKASKRRFALNPTPRHKERERQKNADPVRKAKKRAQALAKYYALHPVRPKPICRVCLTPIAWQPPGRPPKTCSVCAKPSTVARRRRNGAPLTHQEAA